MAVGQSGPDSNPVGSPGLKLVAFYFVSDGFDQFELKVVLFVNNSVRETILFVPTILQHCQVFKMYCRNRNLKKPIDSGNGPFQKTLNFVSPAKFLKENQISKVLTPRNTETSF